MAFSGAELREQIVGVLDRCLAMQAGHVAGLESGGLTEINQWIEERQAMLASLSHAFDDSRIAGMEEGLRAVLAEKLGRILSTEEVLFKLAQQQREFLSAKLSMVRRGKMTLGLYGSTSKNQPPQFVSDKG